MAVDEALADSEANAALHFHNLCFDEKGVSREHGSAKLDVVSRHEIADFPLVIREAQDKNRCGLGHGLELKNPGHDRVVGEVPFKERLVKGNILYRGAF